MADPVVHLTNGLPDSGTGNITTLGQTLLDGANATHGITTGAAVVTDATGTLQQYLRGLVKLFAAALAAGGRLFVQVSDGTNSPAIKAASTAPVASDPALVVAISPNSVNANGQATMANSAPVVIASNQSAVPISNTPLTNFGAGEYETVAASATAQALGVTGATGDYITGILVVPATTSPGLVTLLDNATSIPVFVGGASSVSNLVPFFIPLGMISVSGAWKVTTGTNVSCIGIGNFT